MDKRTLAEIERELGAELIIVKGNIKMLCTHCGKEWWVNTSIVVHSIKYSRRLRCSSCGEFTLVAKRRLS
jgi:DNA-directed RNA polymerase subunit RPC12/RpoP